MKLTVQVSDTTGLNKVILLASKKNKTPEKLLAKCAVL